MGKGVTWNAESHAKVSWFIYFFLYLLSYYFFIILHRPLLPPTLSPRLLWLPQQPHNKKLTHLKLFMAILAQTKAANLKLNYDEIAQYMGPGKFLKPCTPPIPFYQKKKASNN